MRTITIAAALAVAAGSAFAKLPPLSDEAKAKAEEAKAKTAWSDKVAAFQLCKAQDKVAAQYLAEAKKVAKDVKPETTPPCNDPGPFVYAPADGKPPIEQSGAHSPPKTATAPPSTNTPAAAASQKQ
jgi:hypothetical protein